MTAGADLVETLADYYPVAMIPDHDVWIAANCLLERHGCKALEIALQRATTLLARGDDEGHRDWRRILDAVHELTRVKRRAGERLN